MRGRVVRTQAPKSLPIGASNRHVTVLSVKCDQTHTPKTPAERSTKISNNVSPGQCARSWFGFIPGLTPARGLMPYQAQNRSLSSVYTVPGNNPRLFIYRVAFGEWDNAAVGAVLDFRCRPPCENADFFELSISTRPWFSCKAEGR